MNEALQKLEVKVENEGATPQGRLSSAEWNVVVSALKAIDAGDGGLGKDAILKAVREAGYVTRSDVNTIFSEDAVRVSVAQNISAQHNFTNGIKINNLAISQSQGDTIFIDANVVVRGGITARGTNTTQSPSLFDALPIDSRTIKRDANGMLYVDETALNVSGGFDEEQLEVYLTTNQYAKKSDIPSISNITYASVVAALGYTPLSANGGTVSGKLEVLALTIEASNEINGYQRELGTATGNVHLNYRSSGNVTIANGGGNVVVGGAAASEKFQVNGNTLIIGGLTTRRTSDRRLKQNIRKFSASEMLMSLGGVYQFEYIDSEVEENHIYGGSHIGLIYQNVVGTALDRMCYEREDGYGSLNYHDTSFLSLIAGVCQELIEDNQRLKERVGTLEQRK